MTRSQKAYQKLMTEVTKNDANPTFALSGLAIENIVGRLGRLEMLWDGLIKHIGNNSNGISTYKIR